jgi:hypothetical protein
MDCTSIFVCSECGQPGASCPNWDHTGFCHPLCGAKRSFLEGKGTDGITEELRGTSGPKGRATGTHHGRSHKYPGLFAGSRPLVWSMRAPVGYRTHSIPSALRRL